MISNIREGGADVGHQRATPSNFPLVPVSFRKVRLTPPPSLFLQAVCSLSNQQHWDKLRRCAIGASTVNAANVKREATVKTEPGTAKCAAHDAADCHKCRGRSGGGEEENDMIL